MIKKYIFSTKIGKRNPYSIFSYQIRFFSSTTNEALKKQLSEILSTYEQQTEKKDKPSNNITAFDNKMDVVMFNSQYRYYKLNSLVWIVIGTLTFLFIHPLASVIPAWISSGNMLSTFLTNKFAKKLVYKMALSKENNELAHLFIALKQREIVANIKNFNLKEIKEVDVDKKKKYIISFELLTEKKKLETGLKFYLDFDHNRIENCSLFEYILTADFEKIKKMNDGEKEAFIDLKI